MAVCRPRAAFAVRPRSTISLLSLLNASRLLFFSAPLKTQVTAVWLTKSWLPVWFGAGERLFGMKLPPNVVAKSASDVAIAGGGSSSWVMSTVASFMAATGMRWHEMSLNDVCCLLPAWFGALATLVTGMIALECSSDFRYDEDGGSRFGTAFDNLPFLGYYISKYTRIVRAALARLFGMECASSGPSSSPSSSLQTSSLLSMLATMFFMSIVPAHIMRSVGGGYDNESVAMTAMTSVFYAWTRSLRGVPGPPGADKRDAGFAFPPRTRNAAAYGALTGLVYFYMAARWVCFVFVLSSRAVLSIVLPRPRARTKMRRVPPAGGGMSSWSTSWPRTPRRWCSSGGIPRSSTRLTRPFTWLGPPWPCGCP